MRRFHGVELSDLTWFPSVLREAGNAYMRVAGELTGQPAKILPVVASALERSGENEILDLCSGGGGPVLWMARELSRRRRPVPVTLTDRYPSEGARELVAVRAPQVRYESDPVDAGAVPAERAGLRTIMNAFHHFRPELGQRVLASAVEARRPIVVFEVARRSPITLLAILPTPFMVLLLVPFFRPFRVAWLPLTYLVPVIPLFILWDVLVSTLRTYTTDELLALARAADPKDSFDWQAEERRVTGPLRGIALVGIPRERLAES